jgi:hypothetical protein
VVGVAPATVIWQQVPPGGTGTQYPENGIDELPIIHCLTTSAALAFGQVIFNLVPLMFGKVVSCRLWIVTTLSNF